MQSQKCNLHQTLILTLVVILISMLSTGCGRRVGENAANTAATAVAEAAATAAVVSADTLDALDEAIDTLDRNSAQWQQTLQQLESELAQDAQSTIRTEVSNMLQGSIGAASVGVRCNADFIGKRVKESLQSLKAEFLGQEVIAAKPVFCDPVPTIIGYKEVQEGRLSAITIYGYNFEPLSNLLENFRVILVNDGVETDVTYAINNPSGYMLTINLGSNGVPLDTTSNELIVKWMGNKEYSIGISQPQPTQPTSVTCPQIPPVAQERPRSKRGFIWVPAEWNWVEDKFELMPGHWERAQADPGTYIPGHWDTAEGRCIWIPRRGHPQ